MPFANVEAEMVPILHQLRASNPGLPQSEALKQEYERACYANPETRAILIKEAAAAQAPKPAASTGKPSQQTYDIHTEISRLMNEGARLAQM